MSIKIKILPFALSFWILIFGFRISLYAAPCYGTRMPAKSKFSTGVQSYTLFKRYLEDDFGKLRSTQYFLLLSFGVSDWLAIDLKGGAGNIKQRPMSSSEIDYPSSFAGGYGLRLKLYAQDRTKMVFGFQHISVHPHDIDLGNEKNKAIIDDWQVSFLTSYAFKKITPYLGTRWSRIDYIHTASGSRKRKMSDRTKSFGLITGCDIPLSKKVWLNLEGQFLDSEALALSLNFDF